MALALPGGCSAPRVPKEDKARVRMLSLLMPVRIEIVEPFTRVRSFDEDGKPDGIELLLQAVNALDNPGLMIVGHLRVELHEYVEASALPAGRRVAQWEINLATEKDQRTHWNQLTQMYEFRLVVDPKLLPPAERYLLVVTYETPLNDRLSDQYVIQYRTPDGTDALGGTAPPAIGR
jgi:hypothetical protein